jgi:hypothetical protein
LVGSFELLAGHLLSLLAGPGRDSVECAHVDGDVLHANAEEPAYAYDYANNLSGPIK